jgi:hypothetical protein
MKINWIKIWHFREKKVMIQKFPEYGDPEQRVEESVSRQEGDIGCDWTIPRNAEGQRAWEDEIWVDDALMET